MIKNTIAPLCLLACLSALGCTEAGKCRRGEIGCAPLDGRCTEGRKVDGMCVAGSGNSGSGSSGTGGSGGSGSGGGQPDAGPPIDCTDESLDAACEAFCEAFCRNEQDLCAESRCSSSDCDSDGQVFVACRDICSDDGNPERCAQNLCAGQAEYTCEDFGAVDSDTGIYTSLCFENDPNCVGNADYGCSDTCGSIETEIGGVGGDLADDGMCQDGGEGSVSSVCARGTDCSDCSERECVVAGEGCNGHGDCCGFYGDGALCVELSAGPTCLASCTETGACPDGLRCVEVDDNRNSVCAP